MQHAAHLADHVFPRLAVRQWVLAVPKRLRYFLRDDADLQDAVLRIFLASARRSTNMCILIAASSTGCSTQPPRIAPARGPPLWEAASALCRVEFLYKTKVIGTRILSHFAQPLHFLCLQRQFALLPSRQADYSIWNGSRLDGLGVTPA